jgi:pimeloyl-ACP methyl ester carboxylesterase
MKIAQHFQLLCFAMALSACVSPTSRIDAEAKRAGLVRTIVHGTDFRHAVYTRKAADPNETWTVYLESDGSPWAQGRVPTTDPTAREPMALRLMLSSGGPAFYLTRPCYHELMDNGCSWPLWTHARYSETVVDSMVSAIEATARRLGAGRLRLVGHSGGGTLAVLIAERLPRVAEVVTLAANLDTDAWTTHHGYLPLNESLNPARSTRVHAFEEIHLQGAQDKVVPSETTRAYFERFPQAKRVTIDEFDHVCCWQDRWAQLLSQLQWTVEN